MCKIEQSTASFSLIKCDKCNASGYVENRQTVDISLLRDKFFNYINNANNFITFTEALMEFRNWEYKKIKCPKCNGKRQIAVLDENLVK